MQLASKLLSTRRGTLFVAAAAALLAGTLILIYLNGYRNSVESGGAPVTVLIARQNIPKGTSGAVIASNHLFSTTTMRESQLREGAFSDPTSLPGKVTTHEIYKGAQLTATALAVLKRIITDVPVIDVSRKTGSGLGATSTTKVLLKLTDKQAGNLAFASDEGKVWLSLRPGAGATSTPPSLVTVGTVLGTAPPLLVYRTLRGLG